MFHRRLLLLMGVMLMATAALGAQLVRLTVVKHEGYRTEAESALVRRRLVPTRRGQILDRKGRVLAIDRPCFDIAVDYNVITGERAYQLARKDAFRDYRDRWGHWSFDQREAVIAHYREDYDLKDEKLWEAIVRLGGMSRAELDEKKKMIIRRVTTIHRDVLRREAERREAEMGGPVELGSINVEIAEEREPHTILHNVSDEVKNTFSKLAQTMHGLRVIKAKTRQYPYRTLEKTLSRQHLPSPIADDGETTLRVNPTVHLLGGMRDQIWAEDVDASTGGRPFRRSDGTVDLGGYLPGDWIGSGGIEQAEERRLRGERGQVLIRKDTQSISRQAPKLGRDVTLSVDVELQARLQALMHPTFGLMQVQGWHGNTQLALGTGLSGAAVVIEVDSGDILAMVSTPAPEPYDSPIRRPIEQLIHDPMRPLENRALNAIYPPGSTLKPIAYCTAVAGGAFGVDRHVECLGHLLPNRPNLYRCWTWRPSLGRFGQHGPLSASEALARSCNIYFYTLGRSIGARRLVSGLRLWGLGVEPNLGLDREATGIMPWLDQPNPEGRKLTVSNAMLMSIGQGPVAFSPLQVANAHAALARGGYFMSPILIRERADRQIVRDLALPPKAVAYSLRGMRDVIEASYGTAHHLRVNGIPEKIINLDGVTVRAKTGTAQAPNLLDEDGNVLRSGDHSWFVCHVQKPETNRAAYVVVVVVEYGGSGGRVSGPVVNQVLHALKAEGYL